jgi:ABC-type antimicrobial peptide transport system permease subunit
MRLISTGQILWRSRLLGRTRSWILLICVSLVVLACVLLTSEIEKSKVTLQRDLADYWRSSYDILVRPSGKRSAIEDEFSLVRSNYLSGIPGGITIKQYDEIKNIPGVEIAAPIAMISYYGLPIFTYAEPYPSAASIKETGIYKIETKLIFNDNISENESVRSKYLIVTDFPVLWTKFEDDQLREQSIRVHYSQSLPFGAGLDYTIPILIAGIDPAQEAELVGLDQAITHGRYFSELDKAQESSINPCHLRDGDPDPTKNTCYFFTFPILINDHAYVQAKIELKIWKVLTPDHTKNDIHALLAKGGANYIDTYPTIEIADVEASHATAYESIYQMNKQFVRFNFSENSSFFNYRNMVSDVEYNSFLSPTLSTNPIFNALPKGEVNCEPQDFPCIPEVIYRDVNQIKIKPNMVGLQGDILGTFDLEKLSIKTDEIIALPQEIYYPPIIRLIYDNQGNKLASPIQISPFLDPRGYTQIPPTVITTIEAASLFSPIDPISAIRIRVAGIDDYSSQAQEKIEAVASAIVNRTGLDVDVMVGSSPQKQLISLKGRQITSSIGYAEDLWIKKEVGLSYDRAINQLSVLLFVSILTVTLFYMFTTTYNSILGKHKELSLKKALGWRSTTIFGSILIELGFLGFIASSFGIVLGLLISKLINIHISQYYWLFLPLGVILCILGGLIPSWKISKEPPIIGLHFEDVSTKITLAKFLPISIITYPILNTARRFGRSLVAIILIILPTMLLTFFLISSLTLRGYFSQTLLGEYMVLHIKTSYYFLLLLIYFLAVIVISDIISVSVVERRHEIGVLRAIGWREREVFWVFQIEALIIGIMGGLSGVFVGLLFSLMVLKVFSVNYLIPILIALMVPIGTSTISARVINYIIRKKLSQ